MAARPGDTAVYVAEQVGRVWAVRDGRLEGRPVLDVRSQVASGGERGLLGLTFSRDGTKLYVNYTNIWGYTVVFEHPMRADGTADVARRRRLLAIWQPQSNHNGGDLAIGPDGMLWIATGDGGGYGDQGPGHAPEGNGQSLRTLLGKLLRIDPRPGPTGPYRIPADNPFVGRADARPEIWAYGLRNPWRFSFDRTTGDLWVADVGQGAREEVNRRVAGTRGGVNFGWNVWEGTQRFRDGFAPGHVPPVFEYDHAGGRCSITGGYVYRGQRIPSLRGWYTFADYCDGRIRALRREPGRWVMVELGVSLPNVASFGQTRAGELWVISLSDGLYRLAPAA
jgi:glucose/arabinose dehydrogenase